MALSAPVWSDTNNNSRIGRALATTSGTTRPRRARSARQPCEPSSVSSTVLDLPELGTRAAVLLVQPLATLGRTAPLYSYQRCEPITHHKEQRPFATKFLEPRRVRAAVAMPGSELVPDFATPTDSKREVIRACHAQNVASTSPVNRLPAEPQRPTPSSSMYKTQAMRSELLSLGP